MADVVAARITIPVTTDAGKADIDLKKINSTLGTVNTSLSKTSTASQSMAKSLSTLSAGFKFLASSAIIGYASKGVSAFADYCMEAVGKASALSDATGKFDAVFGKFSQSAKKDVDTLTASYGLSTIQATQYMSTMQGVLTTLGLNQKSSSILSGELVRLSADMATFHDVTGGAGEVLGVLQGAMAGNTRGLKQYGIMITEANVLQEAMRLGIVTNKAQLDDAAKAQATYSLIIKATTLAHGDAVRASLNYSSSTKKLKTNIEEFATAVGTKMLPGATNLSIALASVTDKGSAMSNMFIQIGDIAGGVLSWIATKVYSLNLAIAEQQLGWATFRTQIYSASEALKILQQTNAGVIKLDAKQKQGLLELVQAHLAYSKAASSQLKAQQMQQDSITVGNVVIKKGTDAWYKYFGMISTGYGAGLKNLQKGTEKFVWTLENFHKALQVSFGAGDFSAGMQILKDNYNTALKLAIQYGENKDLVLKNFDEQRLKAAKDFMAQQAGNEQLSFAERRQRLDAANAQIQASTALTNDQKLIAQQDYQAQVDILDQAYYAKMLSNVQLFATGATMIMDIAKGIMSAMNAADQQDIENMQEKIRLEDQAVSRKEAIVGKTQEEIDKMNARWAEEDAIAQKQKELRKKQAIQTKAMGIFQAIINTAMAVAGMLAANPIGPWNFVFAALAGIKGAVEIGVIASQPIPSAAFGGQFTVPPGSEADSGLLKVSSGEDVSVTPARNSGGAPQRVTVTIGARDFEGYFAEMTDKVLNSGKVQIRRSGVVKFA